MPTPIKGHEGSLSAGGTNVAWVNNWEIQLDTEEQTAGPFIGDSGNLYTYRTSKRLTGTIEATIPKTKDAGQTILVSGAMNASELDIVLTTTGGYTITIPSGVITSFTMGQDAGETVTASFEFRSNGSFTVV